MRFEISHELDAPMDVLELALMSPDLAARLLEQTPKMESIDIKSHDVSEGRFERVWRFSAKAPLKILKSYNVTREMMIWDEVFGYDRKTHIADFHIVPRPGVDLDAPWRRRINAGGTYRVDALNDGRCRRTVIGNMDIDLRMIGGVVERMAVGELKKAYAAEAEALRSLCSLV